jgi:hypothetical protein
MLDCLSVWSSASAVRVPVRKLLHFYAWNFDVRIRYLRRKATIAIEHHRVLHCPSALVSHVQIIEARIFDLEAEEDGNDSRYDAHSGNPSPDAIDNPSALALGRVTT